MKYLFNVIKKKKCWQKKLLMLLPVENRLITENVGNLFIKIVFFSVKIRKFIFLQKNYFFFKKIKIKIKELKKKFFFHCNGYDFSWWSGNIFPYFLVKIRIFISVSFFNWNMYILYQITSAPFYKSTRDTLKLQSVCWLNFLNIQLTSQEFFFPVVTIKSILPNNQLNLKKWRSSSVRFFMMSILFEFQKSVVSIHDSKKMFLKHTFIS